ncbi:MAG: hypothetical protein HC836_37340, partial [Richelia sp. RM2_1_2]|nr:hypothetical protein [Richelia sp. RM2_1_2]
HPIYNARTLKNVTSKSYHQTHTALTAMVTELGVRNNEIVQRDRQARAFMAIAIKVSTI